VSELEQVKAAFQALGERDSIDFKRWLDGRPPLTDGQWFAHQLDARFRRAGAEIRVRMSCGPVFYDGDTQLTDYAGTDDEIFNYQARFVVLPAGFDFLHEVEA